MNHVRIAATITSAVTVLGLTAASAGALATPKSLAASSTGNDTAKLKLIQSRGNNEISRRLTTLQGLSSKISSATKLSSGDQSSLSAEVNDEITGLTALKTKLSADTTVADAKADTQSIITDYRVYVLIVPKVNLVKVADDQQAAETKLSDLIPKLQSRVDNAKAAGKNVGTMQDALNDLTKQINAAQAVSSSVESSVIGLQPSDYNTDHKVLSGYRDQLKTAQTDIRAAVSDANSVVNKLKNA